MLVINFEDDDSDHSAMLNVSWNAMTIYGQYDDFERDVQVDFETTIPIVPTLDVTNHICQTYLDEENNNGLCIWKKSDDHRSDELLAEAEELLNQRKQQKQQMATAKA